MKKTTVCDKISSNSRQTIRDTFKIYPWSVKFENRLLIKGKG